MDSLYHLENNLKDHLQVLATAWNAWETNVDPDLVLIAEDGSKTYTKGIIIALYSKVFCDIVGNCKASDLISISVPVRSSEEVLNFLKILKKGVTLSLNKDSLYAVGEVAKLFDIELVGVQLGSRPIKSFEAQADLKITVNENSEDQQLDCKNRVLTSNEKSIYVKKESIKAKNSNKECQECGKTFSTNQALVKHEYMHTGERPFSCDVCGKGFTSLFSVKQHKIVHSDVKPFSCPCGEKFTLKSSLKRHELRNVCKKNKKVNQQIPEEK